MSLAEVTFKGADELPRTAPVRHWLRLFRSECRVVFLRPRTLAMLALLVAAPIFLGIVLKINTPQPGSGGGPGGGQFIGQIAENGIFLALIALYFLMALIMPLAVAVVSGDSIAGEAGLGTLRTLLTVPAGRTRLLATKYVVILLFCLTVTVLVGVVGLVLGSILFPVGPVTLLSGNSVPMLTGVLRLLLIAGYLTAALASLGAIGLALSTVTQHAIAVMAATVVIAVMSQILDAVPQVAAIHPYLPTHFWFSFDGLLRSPIASTDITHGLISFAVYIVVFLTIAWARFSRANITS